MCTRLPASSILASYDIVRETPDKRYEHEALVTRVFLAAEWRYLAMLNYRVSSELLLPYVPVGTELDLWNGAAYVSVVGFHFERTRLAGIAIPFHTTFEEVNLRCYIRRTVGGEARRAVCFIRELVPRRAIATVARLVYNEPYLARPMSHEIRHSGALSDAPRVEYSWNAGASGCAVSVAAKGVGRPLEPGSEEEFITQHYWGYTRQRDGGTIEYEVRHPSWNVWHAETATLTGDLSDVYPLAFLPTLSNEPYSAFIADGSAVSVHAPTRIGT
jgi:hypothetical protein